MQNNVFSIQVLVEIYISLLEENLAVFWSKLVKIVFML